MAQGNAQYAIEIAASMSGAEYTSGQLDALSKGLADASKDAQHFEQAAQQLALELGAASEESAAASAALAEAQAEYRGLEKAAVRASDAQAKAVIKADEAAAALAKIPEGAKGYAVAARRAKAAADNVELMTGAAASAKAAASAYASTLGKLERAAEGAAAKQERLSKTSKNLDTLKRHVSDRLGDATTKLSTFRGALGDVGGPLGELAERALYPAQAFVDMRELFGSTAAKGLVFAVGAAAVVAAVLAITAAVIAGTVAIAAWAVGLGDAARSAGLATQAAEALDPRLRAISGSVDDITRATGVGAEDLRGLSKSLLDAGVSAKDLPIALKAAATAEAALGKGGSGDFIAKLKSGQLEVTKFAATVEQKFGGIVARQLMGLDMQAATFKRSIGEIFGGLNIEPVLKGMKVLVGLFDSTGTTGKVIKMLFESVFQPLIDGAQKAAWVVEAFAIGFLKGLLKVYIAVKPVLKSLGEMFGFEDSSLESLLDGAASAGEILAKVFVVVAAAFVAVAGIVTVIVAAFTALALAVPMAWVAIASFAPKALEAISGLWEDIKAFFGVEEWISMGSELMSGLAQGILAGVSAVVSAVSNAVSGAIDTAKGLLGIHSPSKVFAGIGENTGAGLEQGLDDSTEGAQQAMAALVEPPEVPVAAVERAGSAGASAALGAPMPGQAPAPAAPGKSGSSIDLSGATFVFHGVANAEQAETRFGELLTRILEGDVLSLGGEAAPA